MEEQIFYPVKGKINAIGVFVSILMIMGGAYNIFFKENTQNPLFIYYSIILLIGFLFLFINLKSYLSNKSGLYLSSKGIIIKSATITYNISWKEIKSFRSFDRGRLVFIAIDLIDNDNFLQGKSFFIKKIGKMALRKYGTPISVAVNFYNVSKTELLAELNYRLEKYRN